MLPGWRVEDFLVDSSPSSFGFCKVRNPPLPFPLLYFLLSESGRLPSISIIDGSDLSNTLTVIIFQQIWIITYIILVQLILHYTDWFGPQKSHFLLLPLSLYLWIFIFNLRICYWGLWCPSYIQAMISLDRISYRNFYGPILSILDSGVWVPDGYAPNHCILRWKNGSMIYKLKEIRLLWRWWADYWADNEVSSHNCMILDILVVFFFYNYNKVSRSDYVHLD